MAPRKKGRRQERNDEEERNETATGIVSDSDLIPHGRGSTDPSPAEKKVSLFLVQKDAFLEHFSVLDREVESSNETTPQRDLKASSLKIRSTFGNLEQVFNKLYDSDLTENQMRELVQDHTAVTDRYNILEVQLASLIKDEGSQTNLSDNEKPNYQGLPRPSLPTFKGDFETFRSFFDQFDASVEGRNLPSSHKLSILLSCLEGEAKSAVSGIQCSAENYLVVRQILKERFGNTDVLISFFSEKLLNIPKSRDGDFSSFRDLIDNFEGSLRTIESLIEELEKEQSGNSDPNDTSVLPSVRVCNLLLGPRFFHKLPSSVQLAWNRQVDRKDKFNLKQLIPFAKREVTELDAQRRLSSSSTDTQKHPQKFKQPSKASVSTLRVKSTSPQAHVHTPSDKRRCLFCHKDFHGVFKCSRFQEMNLTDRRHLVDLLQLCKNCLSNEHTLNSCKSEKRCFKCSGSHHTLLHEDQQQTQQSSSPRRVNRISNPPIPNQQGRNSQVIIHTAMIRVQGCDRKVRAMIDGGSERTYASRSLIESIKDPTFIGQELHTFEVFGGEIQSENRSKYDLNIRGHSDPTWYGLTVITVDHICSAPRAFSNIPELEGCQFPLADDLSASAPIEILLGMDAMPQVLLPQSPVKIKRLLLVPTIFGFVVGGSVASSSSGRPALASFSKAFRVASPVDSVSSLWELDSLDISEDHNQYPHVQPIRKEGRVEVPLTWKDDSRPNYTKVQADRRQKSFDSMDSSSKKEYSEVFENYHKLGILEEASPEHGSFLPHHGIRQKGKLRIVYDASAKPWKGSSLNDLIHPGENLLADLVKILLRARTFLHPLVGDIEKAFLMVQVSEQDRDFLKVSWIDHHGHNRVSRFARVPFGINSGPYLLLVSILHHLSQLPESDSIQRIRQGLYMDDLVSGHDSTYELVRFKEETVEVFAQIGMNIRNFVSTPSNHSLISNDPIPDRHKVLGVVWEPSEDLFCSPQMVLSDQAKTKRDVLSTCAKVFDPLGLVTPWLIKAKMFLQTLWSNGGSWDDPLTPELSEKWNEILSELGPRPQILKVPRYVPVNDTSEIHCFSDASLSAYATVLYLKTDNQVRFLCSRARVRPLKPSTLTLPRLELMGACLATRVASFVCDAMDISKDRVFFYTDSMIVLGWIRRSPIDVFVRNRVGQICSSFTSNQWSHVSGQINPADLATRGLSPTRLMDSESWLLGPDFIHQRKDSVSTVLTVLASRDKPGLDFEQFSSFLQAKRVFAWMLRFRDNSDPNKSPRSSGKLLPHEIANAERAIIRSFQLSKAPDEFADLQTKGSVSLQSPLWMHRPELDPDTNLIVLRPRNGEDSLPWIPTDSHLFHLIILETHERLHHMGAPSTTYEVLRKFFVLKCRSAVKRILSSCLTCKRFHSRPFSSPEGQLPAFRVKPTRAFQSTGLDHFGPMYTRDLGKVWCLIFSCAVTRAVHLELVNSLDEKETSLAIRRFLSRRGTSSFFMSDNGRSFVLLSFILKGVISWALIPPAAPWWGGMWERVIGTIKRSLKKTVGNSSLSYSELSTVLAELEDCVNRRPLVQNDEFSLTPFHFILGCQPPPMDGSQFHSDLKDSTCADLSRRWSHRLSVSAHLWQRWKREYLVTLRNWRRPPPKSEPTLKPDDIVLVLPFAGTHVPRNKWPMARIVRLVQGSDGRVRSAIIRVRGRETSRPLSCLFPLECSETHQHNSHDHSRKPESQSSSNSKPSLSSSSPTLSSSGQHGHRVQAPSCRSTHSGRIVKKPVRLGY